jgi:hypothetical protein
MRKALLLFSLLALGGCAASYEVVRVPLRDADLYPLARTEGKITVAVDEIVNPKRVWRYFSTDLIGQGILPINIIVSNHGPHRVMIQPADVLLYRGKEVFDPLPLEVVKRAFRPTDTETRQKIDEYLSEVALKENLLGPNERYQGMLFYEIVDEREERFPRFTILTLFPAGELKLNVNLTVLETSERLVFGPFPLSGLPSRSWSTYY